MSGLPNIEGKTVLSVHAADADEGIVILFTDGSILDIGYSCCYGTMKYKEAHECPVAAHVESF